MTLQVNLSKMVTFKKEPNICFQYQLSLSAGQKYCRMHRGEHSAVLSTIIKLPFVNKIPILSIFEWPLGTGFTIFVREAFPFNKCLNYNEYNKKGSKE